MLNKSFKTNYFKVKNLSRSLKDPTTYHQIFLQNNYKEERLRHYIMPLNRNRIVSVYFTNKRCIYFELYDHSGQLIKLVQAVDNVSYFPILSNTSDKFIICYIAQPKAGSAREPFAMFVSHLRLYDADLNCLGETTERYLVESIFMDDKRIVSSFTRKSVDCCKVNIKFHINSVSIPLTLSIFLDFFQNKIIEDKSKDGAFYAPSYHIASFFTTSAK